jgi:pyruvate,water dikinase
VMFTRSPTTGDRSMIAIEGSWGLGSCIVSGEVTPDTFLVNKVTGEIRNRVISEKARQHVPDFDKGGVLDIEVEADKRSAPCVSDHELSELATIGKTIERHYGNPQDIEWSIDESGTVYLLQSRPETVWANKDAQPVVEKKTSAMDHVFAAFGKR